MTRPEAIEAAARRIARLHQFSPDMVERLFGGGCPEGGIADTLRADAAEVAGVVESALLDRIERKVRLQGLVDPDSTDAWSNGWEAALDAVLAILTEIRQGLGPAQSPEAGK